MQLRDTRVSEGLSDRKGFGGRSTADPFLLGWLRRSRTSKEELARRRDAGSTGLAMDRRDVRGCI